MSAEARVDLFKRKLTDEDYETLKKPAYTPKEKTAIGRAERRERQGVVAAGLGGVAMGMGAGKALVSRGATRRNSLIASAVGAGAVAAGAAHANKRDPEAISARKAVFARAEKNAGLSKREDTKEKALLGAGLATTGAAAVKDTIDGAKGGGTMPMRLQANRATSGKVTYSRKVINPFKVKGNTKRVAVTAGLLAAGGAMQGGAYALKRKREVSKMSPDGADLSMKGCVTGKGGKKLRAKAKKVTGI